MNIKSELIGFNNNKIVSLKDIYNLGNIYLTQFITISNESYFHAINFWYTNN